MTPPPIDYKERTARYKQMRENGELLHLSEQAYLDNLHMIGLLWHGPPPKKGAAPSV